MEHLIAIPPQENYLYLTPGKRYKIIFIVDQSFFFGMHFVIKDDNGHYTSCREFKCRHLNGKDWKIEPE